MTGIDSDSDNLISGRALKWLVTFASDTSQETASGVADIKYEAEIKLLRELDLKTPRARWRFAFGRTAPDHLPRRMLYRILTFRL